MHVHNSINSCSLLFAKDMISKNKNLTSNDLKMNNFMLTSNFKIVEDDQIYKIYLPIEY